MKENSKELSLIYYDDDMLSLIPAFDGKYPEKAPNNLSEITPENIVPIIPQTGQIEMIKLASNVEYPFWASK